MKVYSFKESPIKVFGVPFFDEKKVMERLPLELRKQISNLAFLGRRTPGSRVCFRTNTKKLIVKITLETLTFDIGMSIFGCQAACIVVGDRRHGEILELVYPENYTTKVFSKTFNLNGNMDDITIFLPRNEVISDVEISVDDNAVVEEPTPYKYQKPVVFYGSSITEGGCCCNVVNAYTTILSNRLNFDFINMGFSGSAKGELEMADYINKLDMSVFVYDYDHNAPTVEHLALTHEPFFKRIRSVHPEVPVIMMTRPAAVYNDEFRARREVVKTTYNNAVAAGDKNVYFIDGEKFFGDVDRHACAVDTVHPNDLGFYRMANVIEPVLKEVLESIDTVE